MEQALSHVIPTCSCCPPFFLFFSPVLVELSGKGIRMSKRVQVLCGPFLPFEEPNKLNADTRLSSLFFFSPLIVLEDLRT